MSSQLTGPSAASSRCRTSRPGIAIGEEATQWPQPGGDAFDQIIIGVDQGAIEIEQDAGDRLAADQPPPGDGSRFCPCRRGERL